MGRLGRMGARAAAAGLISLLRSRGFNRQMQALHFVFCSSCQLPCLRCHAGINDAQYFEDLPVELRWVSPLQQGRVKQNQAEQGCCSHARLLSARGQSVG